MIETLSGAPTGAAVVHRMAPAGSAGGVAALSRVVERVPPALAAEWQALAGRASEPNCFAEPWFVDAGLQHLRAGDVRLIEVREGGQLIGVLPVAHATGYARLPVGYAVNWTHHHHFLGTPLVQSGLEAAFWRAVLAHLDERDRAAAFLHVNGLVAGGPVHRGLLAARPVAATVHRHVRAELRSVLTPAAYYEAAVRKKKRKELKRLRNRLAELGTVSVRRWTPDDAVAPWCDMFLALERSGWKGAAGSALACQPATAAFFRDALAGAAAAGRLDMLRLDLDGRALALLVTFRTPPGAFSFKIAFDEAFARFSPGVLLEIENLAVLADPEIAWTDSCAAPDHPMIDGLWTERREIVRVSVPLRGLRRRAIYHGCRALEAGSALRRRLAP